MLGEKPGNQTRPANGRATDRAYTLLELLTVLFIISMLVAVVAGLYWHAQETAKRRRATADLGRLHHALESFYLSFGLYPEIPEPCATNLLDLARAKEVMEMDHFPDYWFRDKLPEGFDGVDPWDRPYQYLYHSDRPDSYLLYSRGPDGMDQTDDDIVFQP